jgi:hypothetical protein
VTDLGYERKTSAELERRLAALLDSTEDVIVGPWMGEIGPELLYWIPFLRWVVERFEVDPARLTAISRGGVRSWYAGVAASYADIFDAVTVEDFRKKNEARWAAFGGMKQTRVTYWDRVLLEKTVGWNGHDTVLHPMFMNRFLRRWWKGGLSLSHVLAHLRFRRLEPPALDPSLQALLPDDYVVAAFYFRPSFEATPENQGLVRNIVSALAEETTVVVLDTEIQADEHPEATIDLSDRVLMPLAGAAPAENLELQTAVAARARSWIGTYGGRTHIAPTFGVPCLSFASDRGEFLPSYLDVLSRLTALTGAPYTVLDTSDLARLASLAPTAGVAAA